MKSLWLIDIVIDNTQEKDYDHSLTHDSYLALLQMIFSYFQNTESID